MMDSMNAESSEDIGVHKTIISDLIWLKEESEKRCLFETALWADECLVNQSPDLLDDATFSSQESERSVKDEILANFVRSLIRNKEYHRAVFHAEKFPTPLSPLHSFLLHFAGYMVCMKRQAEADPDVNKKDDRFIPRLCSKLTLLRVTSPKSFDSWTLYLLGLLWKANHDMQKARQVLCDAIKMDVRCWPAWEALASLIKEKAELYTIRSVVPNTSWFYKLFSAKVYQKLNLLRNAVDVYEDLALNSLGYVPSIVADNASATSSLQEHDAACQMFETLRKSDPYRIQSMEVFADSLYIGFQTEKLYLLARFFEKSHKFDWRTCAIMGNYFSRTGQHARAHKILVTATNLSPKNSLLWVLLGHECMELKNPTDAVSAYYKALEIDPLQYRAYYGIGQVYEIFKYIDFALYFYEEAHRCRPTDSRMLVAMGVIFFHLHRHKDAENAFIKAFKVGDIQGNALMKLGNLYEETKELDRAAKAYDTFLSVYGDENHADQFMIAHASLFLAKYNYEKGNLEEAGAFAQRCLGDENTKEEALWVIKQIQMKQGTSTPKPEEAMETNIRRPTDFKTPENLAPLRSIRSTATRTHREEDNNLMAISDDDEEISFG